MRIDLGRDAFTVTYDPVLVTVEAIMLRIRGLGFRPEQAADAANAPRVATYDPAAVPPPVGDALARARTANRLTLVEFYAAWCGPCKVLESTVLGDPRVRDVLGKYEFVKVDTDQHVEPSDHFNVVGLPTMIVLDSGGREVYRLEGMIEAEELARRLGQLAASNEP